MKARRGWDNPTKVHKAVKSLDDHPQRKELGKLLAAMIERDAPQHLSLIPPEFTGRRFSMAAE